MGPSSVGVGIGNPSLGKHNLKHRNDCCEAANYCASNGVSGGVLFFPDLEQRKGLLALTGVSSKGKPVASCLVLV